MAKRDRVFIDKTYRVIHKDINAMMKHKGISFETKEIFMLAMSLAIDTPSEIAGTRDGFFLLKNLRSHEVNMFYLCAWHHFKDVNRMADEEAIYSIAEQCANTGFKTIKRLIVENKEDFMNRILLDTMNKFADSNQDVTE